MAMLDNGILSPLQACRLWGLKKYDFCLYPWIGRTGFSEGGLGVNKVRPIHWDLR